MAAAAFPATSFGGRIEVFSLRAKERAAWSLRSCGLGVRASLDTKVSDMSVNAPKGLFPPEPEHYRGPKLKVAIIGAGLAGMSAAVELLDQGHEVDIYESRPFIGGKVGSFVDKKGNHIEMGLHVFFGCYSNLFRLMKKVGADENLLVKEHTHTFVNEAGRIGELDFRFPVGAPIHGIRAFLSTNQLNMYDKARNALALALSPVVKALIDPDGALRDIRNLDSISFSDWFLSKGGTRTSIERMWDPVAYALGFIDCDNISARCMLTIFALFATKTEASLLRMLKGSPDLHLSGPIRKYIIDRGGRFHLRWGCREILYNKFPSGETYITGISLSKDTPDPLANALLQPQSTGTLVLELDWLPTRTTNYEPLVLCIAGADSSFRLIEINITDGKSSPVSRSMVLRDRFRPMPLCLPILLPTAHALALRMVLQFGVKSMWFDSLATVSDKFLEKIPETEPTSTGDLRHYMIESTLPTIGDSVIPELLLKALEPYRREGNILDKERAELYSSLVNYGSAARLAFAASVFGEFMEAFFWLQLPHALRHSIDNSARGMKPQVPETSDASKLIRIMSVDSVSHKKSKKLDAGQLSSMSFDKDELWERANERISWHEKLDGDDAIQKRVHELVSVGNLEAAVTLLLSTPPEGVHFYPNALRAVALSSAVSSSLHELAVKVVAANMVRTDKSLSGIHLLCAVGRHQEACSQLQDAGCWTDAATLAASHLHGSDYARVLQRWADHVLHNEHNLWRAMILYVAAGAMREALTALRDSKQPDTAAMFLLACREISAEITSASVTEAETDDTDSGGSKTVVLPNLIPDGDDAAAVSEYFGEYQRKLVHLCMDSAPLCD